MVAPCAPAAYSVCREQLCKCQVAGEVLNALPIKAGLTLGGYAQIKSSATDALKKINPPGLNPDGRYNIPWILRTKFFPQSFGQRK